MQVNSIQPGSKLAWQAHIVRAEYYGQNNNKSCPCNPEVHCQLIILAQKTSSFTGEKVLDTVQHSMALNVCTVCNCKIEHLLADVSTVSALTDNRTLGCYQALVETLQRYAVARHTRDLSWKAVGWHLLTLPTAAHR